MLPETLNQPLPDSLEGKMYLLAVFQQMSERNT